MPKRSATSELNQNNWDQEDEPEEAGSFQEAPKEELQKRVIRVAKRRTLDTSGGDRKNIFSGFSGFGVNKPMSSTSTAEDAKKAFSFLSNFNNSSPGGNKPSNETTKPNVEKEEANKAEKEYLSKLKGLNVAMVKWLKENVDRNPLCILTPVFQDYEKYLKDLQNEKDKALGKRSTPANKTPESTPNASSPANSSSTANASSPANASPLANASSPATASSPASSAKKPFFSSEGFSFTSGAKTATPKVDNPFTAPLLKSDKSPMTASADKPFSSPLFSSASDPPKPSFAQGKPFASLLPQKPLIPPLNPEKPSPFGLSTAPTKPMFTFGSNSTSSSTSSPFSFSSLNAKPPEKTENTEEESEEPPKNEFKVVEEKDSVYTKRVKLFVKKDDNFADRGVGNLYVKEAPNNKHQVIVRADTNLGNIIFNIILSEHVPLKRLGKNNVMCICIPTPDEKPPPVQCLLRVKTEQEADELLESLEKFKK